MTLLTTHVVRPMGDEGPFGYCGAKLRFRRFVRMRSIAAFLETADSRHHPRAYLCPKCAKHPEVAFKLLEIQGE